MLRALSVVSALLHCVSAAQVANEIPIALHQLVVVSPAGDAVIRLSGYDADGNPLTYRVLTAPKTGKLYQLSQVFSNYGYNPKAGTQINDGETIITGSDNRVYYQRPSPDLATNAKWDTFTFIVHNGHRKSLIANVTLVPPSGQLVGSNFLLTTDDWTVVGNKAAVSAPVLEPYSRGPLLNYYIMSTDDKINVAKAGSPDASLWYFNAPNKYLGNQGISYGGNLQFTLAGFAGSFDGSNGNPHLVELECASCIGPVGKGIMLVFPVSAAQKKFNGDAVSITIPLSETKGWLKDPQNTLKPWTQPSKCDLIQVLSRLSAFRILGDWTNWYESVALDDVSISNLKGQLPICSMVRPDASICTCDVNLAN